MTQYINPETDETMTECDAHAEGGEHGIPAVGHTKNPDWSGYDLCQECIDEYEERAPIGPRVTWQGDYADEDED